MTKSTVVKKDINKLQRAIVDGLEDIKAQDIQVFDTEHLSALFERVIIASGTSNRQTKGLAASVRDAVRDAGFEKPRMEGEANGEWIIVDCGQAVVHIMQPNFRTYYNLEELWGEKPVRLKLGAAKPAMSEGAKAAKATEQAEQSLKRSNAAKKGVAEAFPSKAQVKKALATKATAKTPAKKTAKPMPDAPVEAAAPVARKTSARKTTAATKAVPAKKTTAKTTEKSAVKVASKVLVVKPPAKTQAKVAVKTAAKVAAKKAAASRKS